MELVTRVQVLNEAVYVSLHAIDLGKGMNLSLLHQLRVLEPW